MKNAQLTKSLLKIATGAVALKRQQFRQQLRRTVSRSIHIKQFEQTEQSMTKALIPFFKAQLDSVAERLSDVSATRSGYATDTKKAGETAIQLASEVFSPREWDTRLIDAVLPTMIRGMGEAIIGQMAVLGINVRKKSTTATEWLESQDDVDLEDVIFETPSGNVRMGFATEYPDWMKRSIKNRLEESFAQPYWKKINDSSLVDVGKFLDKGLKEGWSIARMAREIRGAAGPGFEYYKRRAENIARTESGNALNGARSAGFDEFKEEAGEAGQYVVKVWLSVLSDATRDAHADLDGVEADENGEWNLNGIMIPWPGHYSLPASDRCQCMCTTVSEFGVGAPEEEIQAIMREMEG